MYQYLLFYNLPITRSFQVPNQIEIPALLWSAGRYIHCQRYRDLIILTIVNRIYQFLKDVLFSDWF